MVSVTATEELEPVPAERMWRVITATSVPQTTGTTVRTEAVSPATVTRNTLWELTATCFQASVIVNRALEGGSAVSVSSSTGETQGCSAKSVTVTPWARRWLSATE